MKWYKIILTLVWIIGTIIGMMYTYPFIWIIMVVCIIYPIVYSMLPVPIQDSIDKYVWGLAFLYVSSFAITIAALIIGVRVIEDGSTTKIVSPFYPIGRTLGTGLRVDTIPKLAYCYKREENKSISILYKDMYLLQERDSTFILFSHNEVVAEGMNINLKQIELGHGKLSVCSFIDMEGQRKSVDLAGNDITREGYSAKIVEPPTDPGYIPNY